MKPISLARGPQIYSTKDLPKITSKSATLRLKRSQGSYLGQHFIMALEAEQVREDTNWASK